jgi:CBS domain-containing protein
MSTPAIVVPPTLSLAEAQQLMERRRVRRLPVGAGGRLLGIITRGDLRAAQPSESSLSANEWRTLLDKVPVAEAMTRDPVTIGPDAPALTAAELMLEHKISGLPVVAGGRVVGVITESDLFRLLIAQLTGAEQADAGRVALVCHHCGAVHRGHSLDTVGPDDECWRCHYHLHRCENCRYFDGIVCMLSRVERHEAIPGRSCPAFAYLPPRAVSADR